MLLYATLVVGCRYDRLAAPTRVSDQRIRENLTGSPVTYQSLATGLADNELTVIGLATGSGIPYLITQTSNGSWVPLGKAPNPNNIGFSTVSTGPANSGNLEVIGFTSSGVNYIFWQSNSDGTWHWFGALPGTSSPAVTSAAHGVTGWSVVDNSFPAYFFPGIGSLSSTVSMPWQNAIPQWEAPTPAGGLRVPLTQLVSSWDFLKGVPYLVGLGTDNLPYNFTEFPNQTSQTAPGCQSLCGAWFEYPPGAVGWNPDPQSIPFSVVATGRGNGNNMELVGLGKTDGRLYAAYESGSPPAWVWYGSLPVPSGIQFTSVVADTGNGGSFQVIGLDQASKQPMLTYLDGSGNWHWFGYLPDPNHVQFKSFVTGAGNGGNLQVIGLGAADNLPYLIWQSRSDGSWHWYGALPSNF
jgi:hypothetical protein